MKLLFTPGGSNLIVLVEIKISGENLMHQSVSLLRVKDPLFKRMGASRLARFAKDGNLNYLCISSQTTWYQYLKKKL